VEKTLDQKLAALKSSPAAGFHPRGCQGCRHGIRHRIAREESRWKNALAGRVSGPDASNRLPGLVDIMLMSASTSEILTIQERIFDASPVTPAVRANDSTDIHIVRESCCRSAVASVRFSDSRHIQAARALFGIGAQSRRKSGSLFCHVQQRPGPRPQGHGSLQRIPPGSRGKAIQPFLEVFIPTCRSKSTASRPRRFHIL